MGSTSTITFCHVSLYEFFFPLFCQCVKLYLYIQGTNHHISQNVKGCGNDMECEYGGGGPIDYHVKTSLHLSLNHG